jgi:hypothetical protein
VTGEGSPNRSLILPCCDAFLEGCEQALLAEITGSGRRANASTLFDAMTDDEVNVRDMLSMEINHTGLATSEDLRWGMFSPVLVCVRGQMIDLICNAGLGSA